MRTRGKRVRNPAAQNNGAIAVINTSSLSVPNPCTQNGVSTMWEGTSQIRASWAIAQGLHVGQHYDGSCGNGVQFYWADNRVCCGYNEHYPGGSVSFNTNYAFRIEQVGGDSWQLKRSGNLVGTSVQNPCCSLIMQAGAESHQDQITISGTADGLQKKIGSTWSYGWSGAFLLNTNNFFSLFSSNPSAFVSYAR